MNILFWNIRGLGSKGRRAQLKKIINEFRIGCVCISETIKQSFTNREVSALGGGPNFVWKWVPSQGLSGGLLVGVDDDICEISDYKDSNYFQTMMLTNRENNFKWRLFNVYGPVQDNRKQEFLSELEVAINEAEVPILAGGDFNLVRRVDEKPSGNVNTVWMDAFNEFVANTELRELHRTGGQYTWTNKQINPIMVMLDRVFMSATWEHQFPLVSAHSATRIGSDHNPLVVETSPERSMRSKIFRFEAAWTKQEGFREWVMSKWPDRMGKRAIDAWQLISTRLRKYLRGWNGNWGGDMKKRKQDLLLLIQDLDKEAERRSLEDREWEQRYSLEEELVDIYNKEEVMWQTRGGERWLLEGDANTSFFHGVANGRK
jgi:mannosylglycoprotein endo-beta-mannosidase